jgi:NADH dehydrogenase
VHDPRAEFRAAAVPPKPRAVDTAALPPQKAEAGSPAEKQQATGSGQAAKSAS